MGKTVLENNPLRQSKGEGLETKKVEFYVLLTMHPGMILVNNQLDAQFFIYIYVYSVHVSGSHVLIIRRITVSMRHLVYVTLCR